MIRTIVDAPGVGRYTAESLSEELARGAAGVDGLQHVNIRLYGGCVVFTLFLRAGNRGEAAARAEQLCRRTMACVAGEGAWSVRGTAAGP